MSVLSDHVFRKMEQQVLDERVRDGWCVAISPDGRAMCEMRAIHSGPHFGEGVDDQDHLWTVEQNGFCPICRCHAVMLSREPVEDPTHFPPMGFAQRLIPGPTTMARCDYGHSWVYEVER